MILKYKLNGKNEIQAINSWVVALFRYGAGIISLKVDELKKVDRTTRKTLTMYETLHTKSDIDQLYLKRKIGRIGLIRIDKYVRSWEKNLGFCVCGSNENASHRHKKVGIVKTENLSEKEDFKKNSQNEFKDK